MSQITADRPSYNHTKMSRRKADRALIHRVLFETPITTSRIDPRAALNLPDAQNRAVGELNVKVGADGPIQLTIGDNFAFAMNSDTGGVALVETRRADSEFSEATHADAARVALSRVQNPLAREYADKLAHPKPGDMVGTVAHATAGVLHGYADWGIQGFGGKPGVLITARIGDGDTSDSTFVEYRHPEGVHNNAMLLACTVLASNARERYESGIAEMVADRVRLGELDSDTHNAIVVNYASVSITVDRCGQAVTVKATYTSPHTTATGYGWEVLSLHDDGRRPAAAVGAAAQEALGAAINSCYYL